MPRQIRAIVFKAPQQIEVRSMEMPDLLPDELLVESLYTFISPGTELRVLAGAKESKGKFPLIPGYCVVGRVVEVGADVKGWSVGELITSTGPETVPGYEKMWGGQASHHRYKPDGLVKLPDGADPWPYVLAEVAAISHRGVTSAIPGPSDTAIVIGQGMIGALAARWLTLFGAKVIVTDLEASRLERARQLGAYATIDGRLPDAEERLRVAAGGGADVVVEASASIPGALMARRLLRQPVIRPWLHGYKPEQSRANATIWPRLLFLATYTKTFEITPGPAEYPGTYMEGALVLATIDRSKDDRQAAVRAIAAGQLDVSSFLDGPTPVEDAPATYARLRDEPGKYTAAAFTWGAK